MCQKHTSIKVERHWELFPPQRRCQMYKRSSSRYKQMSIFFTLWVPSPKEFGSGADLSQRRYSHFAMAQAATLGVH